MRGRGGESNHDAPRQRLPKAKAIRRESEGRGGGCEHHSSRQLGHHTRGEGNLSRRTTYGVEISIAGGVGEVVRANYTVPFFLFFFFFLLTMFIADA